jgi:hypothetical protein
MLARTLAGQTQRQANSSFVFSPFLRLAGRVASGPELSITSSLTILVPADEVRIRLALFQYRVSLALMLHVVRHVMRRLAA